ncbi:hypothetical protein L0F63_006184, partial [Massospora cicadina]
MIFQAINQSAEQQRQDVLLENSISEEMIEFKGLLANGAPSSKNKACRGWWGWKCHAIFNP